MSSSLLRSPSGVVDLFEAAHDAEPDTQRWTLRVLEGARRLFCNDQALVVSGFASDGSPVGELLRQMALPDQGDRYAVPLPAELKQVFGALDPRWVDVFY